MKKVGIKRFFVFDEPAMLFSLAILVFLAGLGLASWFGYQYWAGSGPATAAMESNNKNNKDEEKICDYWRVLDGLCTPSMDEINPKLVAVMIDNHLDARPSSGLSRASVVYEAPVEGNFTRFLAVYPADLPVDKVGPVRSVRPYFLDWLREYGDALYMHVGGSPDGLARVAADGVNDLNEFYRGWYYWRDYKRDAPYNVYTSSELWNKALVDYEDFYETTEYAGWKFGGIENCENNCASEIEVTFLLNSFNVIWKYNTSTLQYERWQSGSRHTDQDGEAIVADAVIIQKVKTTVLDGVGRLGMETVGSGEAIVFARGNVFSGEWRKDAKTARTKWYDSAGEEISLKSGKIWVEIVNQRGIVDFGF